MTELERKIVSWLANGETGDSSESIAFTMLGITAKRWGMGTPSDPADLKRCLKLLREVPEIRPRMGEMKAASPHWAALIDRWDELEACFMSEVAEWLENDYSDKRAPKTWALMESIREPFIRRL